MSLETNDGNSQYLSHLMKLILARREIFLYKQSGVVTNCKWTTVVYRKFIAIPERKGTYQGDEKNEDKPHAAHGRAERRNKSDEDFR